MENEEGTQTETPWSRAERLVKLGWTMYPNCPPDHAQDSSSSSSATAAMMDDEEKLGEGEIWDDGDQDQWDDGYLFVMEEGRLVVVGREPKPARKKMGPPPPHAITFEKWDRKIAETGVTFIRRDDPFGRSNWNPFPVAKYYSPPPSTAGSLEEDLRLGMSPPV